MKPLPSRLRRLDEALASLPLDEPMLLTELDGSHACQIRDLVRLSGVRGQSRTGPGCAGHRVPAAVIAR